MHRFLFAIHSNTKPFRFLTGLLLHCFMAALFFQNAHASFTHEVQAEITGKPVVWGKPLSGGPVRTLFIAPRFTLGDVAQLAARFDMDYETVALWSADRLGFDPMAYAVLPDGGSREEVLQRLQEKLAQHPDVIVLANFDTDILPEAIFSGILDCVASGTGLLLAHTRNGVDSPLHVVLDALPEDTAAPPLLKGVGICLFPGWNTQKEIGRVFSHGNGRIVALDYLGDPPRNHCLIQPPSDPLDMDAYYEDNAYSFVARAICIAAKRRDSFLIDEVYDRAPQGPQEDEIPPDFYAEFVQAMKDSVVAQPARPFRVTFAKPTESHYTVSAQLRRVASNVLISWHDPEMLPKGTTSHQFEIPVGSGAYTLDVWLHDRSGIVDWYSRDFELSGWPEFHDMKLDKTWLLPNDSLEISLEVRPVANHTRQATVYARAVDGYDRVVSEAAVEVDNNGGPVRLRLHFMDLLSTLVKVEVYALEGKQRAYSEWELHSAFREYRLVSVRQKTESNTLDIVGSVSEIREYLPLYYLKCLSEAGMNWVHAPAGECAIVNAAKQQLCLLPQVDAKAAGKVWEGRYREPCLSNASFRNENKDALRDATLRHWAGGFGRYSLGECTCVSAFSPLACQSRDCMMRFQEMLSREYESLGALNKSWDQQFGDWDFVEMPLAFGPGEQGPYAPWIDFRRCMDTSFAEYNSWARQMVQQTDIGAMVGACFSSDSLPARGYYWPLLFDALDFVACDYSPLMTAKIRSYSKPGAWSGAVIRQQDVHASPEWCRWLPWTLATKGVHALWLADVFGDVDHPAPDAWLLPDGRVNGALNTLVSEVNRINDTVGPLLYASEAALPLIAVYDSHASQHFAEVDRLYGRTASESQDAVVRMLRLAGYPFRFVDKGRLLDITPDKCKVILLPACSALDKEEIQAFQNFVERGGALIADIVPGDVDAHGVLRNFYSLSTVFGVNLTGISSGKHGKLSASLEGTSSRTDAGYVLANASVCLDAGVPLGSVDGTPAWVVNRHGAGNTLLLNHPFRNIVYEEGKRLVPHEYHAIKTFIADLPGITHDEELEAFLGDMNVFHYGDAEIYLIVPDQDAPNQRLHLPINRDKAAYNMFTGEKYRRPHRIKYQIPEGQPLAVSALPYTIKDIVINVPEIVHIGGRLPIQILMTTEKGRPGKHLFIVDLMPVNGSPILWYRRVVAAQAGVGEAFIPLARNEVLGKYTLRVYDILTGMERLVPVALSSPERK